MCEVAGCVVRRQMLVYGGQSWCEVAGHGEAAGGFSSRCVIYG